MITFLPYASYEESAACLDRARLGKQRLEAKLLLQILQGKDSPWKYHPIVAMWKHYPYHLAHYGKAVCLEWRFRGYRDSQLDFFTEFLTLEALLGESKPWWTNNEALYASHRSNLLRKDSGWYTRFAWDIPPDLPYVWPKEDKD